MATENTPAQADPEVLFEGALSTTLTTTLVTSTAAERGTRITAWWFIVTGSDARAITFDYKKGATARKIINAASFPATGLPVDVLDLLTKEHLILDPSDVIRGGQGSGTDVDCVIMGYRLKD